MNYEIWDAESGNMVGYFDNAHDAALSIRDLSEVNSNAFEWLMLGITGFDNQRIGYFDREELKGWVEKELNGRRR